MLFYALLSYAMLFQTLVMHQLVNWYHSNLHYMMVIQRRVDST